MPYTNLTSWHTAVYFCAAALSPVILSRVIAVTQAHVATLSICWMMAARRARRISVVPHADPPLCRSAHCMGWHAMSCPDGGLWISFPLSHMPQRVRYGVAIEQRARDARRHVAAKSLQKPPPGMRCRPFYWWANAYVQVGSWRGRRIVSHRSLPRSMLSDVSKDGAPRIV